MALPLEAPPPNTTSHASLELKRPQSAIRVSTHGFRDGDSDVACPSTGTQGPLVQATSTASSRSPPLRLFKQRVFYRRYHHPSI
jgi:hypothetical protein